MRVLLGAPTVAFVAILAAVGSFFLIALNGHGSTVNETKWVIENEAIFASLQPFPSAQFAQSTSWGIPDRVVRSPDDVGRPYGGYMTQHVFELPKPTTVAAIGAFYVRQLSGWTLKNFFAQCEWSFASPAGALLYVDACRGHETTTSKYEVDINYADAQMFIGLARRK